MQKQQFKQINNRFDQLDKKFTGLFERVDRRFDLISRKLIEHDFMFEKIQENMATKKDINRIDSTLDGLVKKVEDIKQENSSHLAWLKRHDKDINKLKTSASIS